VEGQPYAVPEQLWIRLLERAVAVMRQGDTARARQVAAEAFSSAAAQGQADLPVRFEPMMVTMLGDLVPGGAVAPQAARLSMLGRFAISDRSGDRSPPPGLPQLLVALVALRSAVPVDEAIEMLWPDVDAQTGRSRLRNLLNRVRERSGLVIERSGELLALADGVEVDALVFDRLADGALAAPVADRCGLARHALSQWSGELLPEHRYVDWLAGHRERLRRRYVRLLDEVISDSIERGELDDAIRHLELAIECEPLDEARHVQLVSALVRQGRRGSARAAVVEAMRVADDLGVPHSDELSDLAALLATGDASP
jgi:DNA-binding SARP family transcriptional activator